MTMTEAMETTQANPARARQDRASVVAGGRRRRTDTLNQVSQMGMQIFSPDQLDLENYVYRWAVDKPGRLHQLTKLDDYDFVDCAEIPGFIPMLDGSNAETESLVRVVANSSGGKNDGNVYAYLLKKPRQYWEEDNDRYVNLREGMMERRVLHAETVASVGTQENPGKADPSIANVYVPPGNKIGHAGERVVNPERRRGKIT